MKSNIGKLDRTLRFILGVFLLIMGITKFNAFSGNLIGISISLFSLLPLYVSISGYCFICKSVDSKKNN